MSQTWKHLAKAICRLSIALALKSGAIRKKALFF